jgi:aspartate/glutamate racemase
MIERYKIKGVILGCTELGLTMTDQHWVKYCGSNIIVLRKIWDATAIPIIDATDCHIETIVDYLCNSIKA